MKAQLTLDGGDTLTVTRDPHTRMWISPCNGQQHPTGYHAMGIECEAYYLAIGVELEEQKILSIIAKTQFEYDHADWPDFLAYGV